MKTHICDTAGEAANGKLGRVTMSGWIRARPMKTKTNPSSPLILGSVSNFGGMLAKIVSGGICAGRSIGLVGSSKNVMRDESLGACTWKIYCWAGSMAEHDGRQWARRRWSSEYWHEGVEYTHFLFAYVFRPVRVKACRGIGFGSISNKIDKVREISALCHSDFRQGRDLREKEQIIIILVFAAPWPLSVIIRCKGDILRSQPFAINLLTKPHQQSDRSHVRSHTWHRFRVRG